MFKQCLLSMTRGDATKRAGCTTTENLYVGSNYNMISDNLRRCTPNSIQCSIFCGGRRCKYENPDYWDTTHMAINGIFSHWVTDDILAMARPCTEIIVKKKIIEQFKSLDIKSLINLQQAKEHCNCGCPLEQSGFTYDPTLFMQNDIYYYNYGWDDYGEASLASLLDMVKIINYSLTEGKVAIHCHAGLGRTGVLIACFLVYTMRFRANDAIKFVRLKRPNAVQTRGQIMRVQEFEQFIWPRNVIFCSRNIVKDKRIQGLTLSQHLVTQKFMLHGYETRCFRYIPKIVYIICERLLKLCSCKPVGIVHNSNENISQYPTVSYFLAAKNHSSVYQHLQIKNKCILHCEKEIPFSDSVGDINKESDADIDDEYIYRYDMHKANSCNAVYKTEDIVEAILVDHTNISEELKTTINQHKINLNHGRSSWSSIQTENNLTVLTGLLMEWFEHLKTPIIHQDNLSNIVIYTSNPLLCLQKFELAAQYTIEYLFRFMAHLGLSPRNRYVDIIQRIMASLTQQMICINGCQYPPGKSFRKLRLGTLQKIMEFSMKLLNLIFEEIYQPCWPAYPCSKENSLLQNS